MTKVYNIELPKWFNDSRTVEQMIIRVLVGVLSYQCLIT